MAAIDQYLQKILEATYGEEVRDSIHDAIKQNYLDITESVNRANAAAAAANTAAQNVNAVVDTANQAASTANEASSTANAASQRATAAATLVEEIEQDYENATAEATAVQPGGAPTATLVDGPNGKKFVFGLPSGATPQIGIGTVTTGAAGSNAEVTISGSADAPRLNFTIPRGDTGATPTVYGNTVPMSSSDSTTVAQAIANATDADAVHSVNGKSAINHAATVYAEDVSMSGSDSTNIPNKLKQYVKSVNGNTPDPITGNVTVPTGGGDASVGLIRRVIGIAVSDWAGSGPYTYTYQDSDIKVGMVVLEDTLSDEYAQLGINTYTVQNGSLTIATTVKPTASWSLDIALGMDGSSILDDVGDLQTKVGTSTLTTTAQNLSDAVNELDDGIESLSGKFVPVSLTFSDFFTFSNGITSAGSTYNQVKKIAPHIAYIHIEGYGDISTGGFIIGTTSNKVAVYQMINCRGTISRQHHPGQLQLGPSTDAVFYTDTAVNQFAAYGIIYIND